MAMLLFTFTTYSQVEPADSVTVVQQGSTAPATDDYQSTVDDETVPFYSDTLRQNFRSIVYDSIVAINTDKGFYYKRYMDSLLRATQVKKEKPARQVDLGGVDFFNSVFGILFWILAIGLFTYLVYRLFLSNSAIFSRNRRNVSADVSISTEENTTDPDALVRNAIRNGNYRLAIRYLYLQVLDKLSERKAISIHPNKTNYEYVQEVRKHRFANEFASLTLKYEYVWYGEYPVDEKLFGQIQESFTQFNKNLTR